MHKVYYAPLLAALLALTLTGCFRDEEAERTPDIDFYIQYASERFGIPPEDISVVEFQKGTSVRYGLFQGPEIPLKPVVRLEWNGKMVSFSYSSTEDYYDTSTLRNDYCYDELYECVREYYISSLGVREVFVQADSIFRACLKIGKTPTAPVFYRHTSLLFLAGRQPACKKAPRLAA